LEYITAFRNELYLPKTNDQKVVVENQKQDNSTDEKPDEVEIDTGLTKALDSYRKINEIKELTDEEQENLEKKIEIIKDRDIIEVDPPHEPEEYPVEKGKITIGPPTLTRFEKARIMGSRALQLSLGAPPFITIPQTANTSLDIAMLELEKRVIPIIIRRVLPNRDYQNIPIDYFQ